MNLLAQARLGARITITARHVTKLLLLVSLLSGVSAFSQTTLALGWNQSTGSVAGYYVFQGTNTHLYTKKFDAGKNLLMQFTNLTAGVTYYYAVTSYTSTGVESDFSSEASYTASSGLLPPPIVNLKPGATLTPDLATITAPFILSGGMISQALQTTVTTGGSLVYNITNAIPGNYVIWAQVKAPSTNANSFYINIDAQPTDPMMIWNLAVSSALTNEVVSWQGISDFVPKVFFLSAGNHQVIVRGREANVQLGAITFMPAPLQLQMLSNRQVIFSGVAQTNQTYQVQATSDFKTWTTLGNTTTDATGKFKFTDTTASSVWIRNYRIKG